jgi:Spy/CpxP family protein refolding chaperone
MEFLRSLNLTAAQRDQIRSIHEKYRPQLEAVRNGTRSQIESARTARQRGDTAAARAALQSVRQSTEQQMVTIHEQMFREVRGVLTADQRAKVDSAINERIQRLDQQKALLQRLRQ